MIKKITICMLVLFFPCKSFSTVVVTGFPASYAPVSTCQSLGYECCDTGTGTHYSAYDGDCGAGQECWSACDPGEEAATEYFWVTQDGTDASGGTVANGQGATNPFSAADFNNPSNWDTDVSADGKIGPGDRVYFSGTISSRLYPQVGGSSSGRITLDGYEAGNCDQINSYPCGAVLGAGIEAGDFSSNHPDYITIQDFQMTRTSTSPVLYFRAPTGQSTHHIEIKRNYIHHAAHVLTYFYEGDYIWFEGNRISHFGQSLDAPQGMNFILSRYVVLLNNVIEHDEITYPSQCLSANLIETHGCHYWLIEGNTLDGSPNQKVLSVKEDYGGGNSNFIVRFNRIVNGNSGGISYGGNSSTPTSYAYTYANYFGQHGFTWNTGGTGSGRALDCDLYADHIYNWSNLFVNSVRAGYGAGGNVGGYIEFWNNLFSYNGDRKLYAADTTEYDLARGGLNQSSGANMAVVNNIFFYNRPLAGGASNYDQFYTGVAIPTLDYNTYYHPNGTATMYYSGGHRTLAVMQSTYSKETNGHVRDPLFTDANGADNTYGTIDDDYTLSVSSNEIGAGTDRSFASPVQVNIANSDAWLISKMADLYSTSSGIVTMTGDEGLDPDTTDWTGALPVVDIVHFDSVGWPRGPYGP